MAYMLKKTATIGIGGTGMHAVLHMKKKLYESYGEIPPMMKFLVIDTTDKDQLISEKDSYGLDPGEFLKMEVRNPGSLMRSNKEVKSWLPDNVPKFALTAGAKQVRPLGRMAVFANSSPLESKLNSLIASVRDFRVERLSEKFELLSNLLIVNVVCSLAGGTGSGCFIDISILLKNQLETTDKMIGYFLLPDVFVGKPATDNVEPNTYGALRELNTFFTEDLDKIQYYLGGRERKLSEGLFNATYLINNMNKMGVEYSDIKDLEEFLGMGMFLQSSSAGKGASDIIDNLEGQLVGKKWYGQPTVFSSFGISELVYPGDWFADFHSKVIALDIIQKTFLGGDVSKIGEFTDNFIQRVGIREHLADDVIDSILVPGSYKKFALPKDFNKEIVSTVLGKREVHLNDVQGILKITAKENFEKFKEDKLSAIQKELQNIISKPQGIEFAKSFLNTLIGTLSEFKNEMIQERDENEAIKSEMKPKYEAAKSDVIKASKAFFGANSKIENTLKQYKRLVEIESGIILEIERREKSIEFFAVMIEEVKNWMSHLEAFSNYCGTLIQEINQEVQHKRHEKRIIKPFMHEVKHKSLKEKTPKVETDDFLKWMKSDKKLDMIDVIKMRVSEVKDLLIEYGASLEQVKEISNMRIEEILKEITQSGRKKYVEMLDKMASPLWQYNQGLISGDKRTENIYLFGVEDKENTIFNPQDLQTAISSEYEPLIISTGDPKRVTCFKVEAAVPAFVIKDMERYKDKYSSSDKPFSYHIHKDWERDLPDLFPSAEAEENRKFWSLGLADPFTIIIKIGEHYYIKSKVKGKKLDDFKVKLAQGRSEAMKAFLNNDEFVEETKDAIEKIAHMHGNNKVIEELREYGENIERNAKKYGKEIRIQLEMELNDIENYTKSLIEP